ncbi:MAG: hypothetical protein LBR62_03395, partial [Puniceicoccales bacterium]|nr:hypothetical protein [Puniceicoccales bacterium]
MSDPGIPFSAGNCFLFAQTGKGPFLFVFSVFILGLLSKISLLRSSPRRMRMEVFKNFQKPYFAFEATGDRKS